MPTTADFEPSPTQREAIESSATALVVTASAGSGKTEVVARRVERLISDDPDGSGRILAVSYTLKAAEEMLSRLRSRIGDVDRRVDCETIHHFAHALLRKAGTWVGLPVEPQVITEDADRVALLQASLESQGYVTAPDRLLAELHEIDLARARCGEAPHLAEWRETLAGVGAVDYPAMIEHATELAQLPGTNRQLRRLYDHVIVDEAQNLTPAQYGLLTSLAGPPPLTRPTMMLVGDTKQSIVGFAGADATLIARFASGYSAEVISLSSNFRCAARIQQVVDAIGKELGQGTPAEDVDHPAPGWVRVCESATEQAEGEDVATWVASLLEDGLEPESLADDEDRSIVPEDIAVLGRSAATLREISKALERRGIPSAMAVRPEDWVTSPYASSLVEVMTWYVGDDFVPRRNLATLLGLAATDLPDLDAVLGRMRTMGESWSSLADIVGRETPPEVIAGLSDVNIGEADERAAEWEADRQQIVEAWDDFCRRTDINERSWAGFRIHISRVQRTTDLTEGVRLMTIHKAQGREFRAVAVLGLNDGQLPDFRNTDDPIGLEAELRALYVAVSRPSRMLFMSRAQERATRYGPRKTEPSRFLPLVVNATR